MTTHDKLIHVVTEYDRKEQSKGKYYNMYALGMYIQGVHNIDEALATGTQLRPAIVANFTGRLLDKCLKAVGEATSTREEQR